MKKRFLSLFIILIVFVTNTYGAKNNISAPADVRITVLSDGTALWRENRDVMLEKGENSLEFQEVPLTIDNPSIILRSLTEPENLRSLKLDYPYLRDGQNQTNQQKKTSLYRPVKKIEPSFSPV